MPSTPSKFGGFGGHWTDKKLQVVQTYFASFNQALSKTKFTRVYIDAFAGGGRVKQKVVGKKQVEIVGDYDWFAGDSSDADDIPTSEGLDGPESERLRHGSPLLALEADPGFDEFIFIERNPATMEELKEQVNSSPSLRRRPVEFICEDANVALARICQPGWSRTRRATIFLDPFALQIRWSTLEAIARTKGMDMWMLFPAMAVNRMLPRNGKVPEIWAHRLTETFGDSSYRQEFYAIHESPMEGEGCDRQFMYI